MLYLPSVLFESIHPSIVFTNPDPTSMNINILLITLLALTTHSYDWTPVDNIIQAVINVGGFPGAVLTIANATHTIYSNTYGSFVKATPPLLPPPMQQDTMFDIASLSKIAGTLGVIMQMVDTGLVTVNDLVIKYVPEYDNNGKSPTTLKNLLLHNAGLIPDYPGNAPDNKKQVMDWLYTCKLNYTIGTQYVYSDLSFILLAEIAERVLKKPLDVLVRDNLKRMEITNTMYNPDSSLHYKIAPTEYSAKRKQLIRGVVHDPTAWAFGGVAGHAGVFSDVNDLLAYMQVHLRKGVSKSGTRVYNESIVEMFADRVDGLPYNNKRALGWDTVPVQDNPPCGHFFSPRSFGHTGFTGTMMWADRQKNLIVVLLTNRVHPTSFDSSRVVKARSDVCDATVKILGY